MYSAQTFFCKKCKEIIQFTNVSDGIRSYSYKDSHTNFILQYFHDKAVAREIDNLSVSCPHDKCNWTGEYRQFQVSYYMHMYICTAL